MLQVSNYFEYKRKIDKESLLLVRCCSVSYRILVRSFKPFPNGPHEASRGLHRPEREREETETLHFINLNEQCVNIKTVA